MNEMLIRMERIRFAYEAERPVLADVDLALRAGERVGLRGANGAGKSTLLHLIVGLLTPAAGRLEVLGRVREREADFEEVRARVGLLFQDPDDQLFCPTVVEDVAFGPLNLGRSRDQARVTAARTLASLGLAGYEERITHHLSLGEKRLVSLAAVLAMEPAVLLLDEPTSGLDPDAEARVVEVIDGLSQAMVVVSHERGVLDRLASRTLCLDGGRLGPA